MAFTNNRLDLFDGESYGEIQHANAFAKGLPNFVVQGLELTGNTLNNGIFVNNGTFGQLGTSSETHTITANYTGFIVIESTLSGRTSTNRIIESTTFLSTDPRTASNVRYFTIYELSNGSIVNDFRHIDYVKSFEVKNIGESQFVFILNGFVSAPFDASVLAGNRTLINEIDIGYDDTIHATTLIQDILKDLYDKSQAVVGIYKPFELTFLTAPEDLYNNNLSQKIQDFIVEKYGNPFGTIPWFKFKLEVSTAKGSTEENYVSSNKCSVWNKDFYFEWEFEYDNWANVVVRDAKGYLSTNRESLYESSGVTTTDVTLSDSIYNFEEITCGISSDVNSEVDGFTFINVLGSAGMSFQQISAGTGGYYLLNCNLQVDATGKNVSAVEEYARRYTVLASGTTFESWYLRDVSCRNRIYPIGTTHSLREILGKIYRVATFPSGEEKATLLPNQETRI